MSILSLAQHLGFSIGKKKVGEANPFIESATLANLKKGQRAQVKGFHDADKPSVQRLMQLGVIKGEYVELLRSAPGGDPIEYRIMGYNLSLRRAEAAEILVECYQG